MRQSASAAFVLAAFFVCSQRVLGELLLGELINPKVNELIKIASETCDILSLDVLLSQLLEPDELDIVEFSPTRRRRYRLSKAHIRLQETAIPSTIVIYIPGWWNTPNDESSQAVVNALLLRNPLVLHLDTQSSFSRGYVSSAARVRPISRSLYNFIERLSQSGINPASLHIVGFSLGGHVAGLAGRLVQRRLNQSIGRITALDPAKPCFSRLAQRLQRDDANFVHVIHSSPGVVGLKIPIGHMDVYLNGVSGNQPQCRGRSFSAQCDHSTSWRLYVASVTNSSVLLSRLCEDWSSLVDGVCHGSETVAGYDASSNRGLYLYRSSNFRH